MAILYRNKMLYSIISIAFYFFVYFKDAFCDDPKHNYERNVEYSHYLKQVADTLESDPEFRKKLESLNNESSVLSVADHLNLVSHNVRTKLDELKRLEIDRLNKLEARLEKLQKQGDDNNRKVDRDHIDLGNDNKFEIEDLRKLIAKTVAETENADKEAEMMYRRYQMEKEVLRRSRLAKIKSKELREKQRLLDDKKRTERRKHEPVHYPGSEEQFKEVWDKEDKLDRDNFEPISFFRLHDTNADGHFDIYEVEALMQKELKKMYGPNVTEDDLIEMHNEMRRMRQEVFKEIDTNRDLMISFAEYIRYIKSSEFKTKKDWKPLDESNTTMYSKEELNKFAEDYARKHPDVNIKEIEKVAKEEETISNP